MRISPARAAQIGVALLGFPLFLAVAARYGLHFNALTGVYAYDPRREAPNRLFVLDRPDEVLVQTLTRQVERDGSYPAGARAKLSKVEPIRVEVDTYSMSIHARFGKLADCRSEAPGAAYCGLDTTDAAP